MKEEGKMQNRDPDPLRRRLYRTGTSLEKRRIKIWIRCREEQDLNPNPPLRKAEARSESAFEKSRIKIRIRCQGKQDQDLDLFLRRAWIKIRIRYQEEQEKVLRKAGLRKAGLISRYAIEKSRIEIRIC